MPQATTFRVKVRNSEGKLKTVGKARTPSGLKGAYSRARNGNPKDEITIVAPSGSKHTFGPEVKKLTEDM